MNIIKILKKSAVVLTAVVLLFSCKGNKKDALQQENAQPDSLSLPENVKQVSAVAKVEPANGFINLSAAVSGMVAEMYKSEGDPVSKGEVILKLDAKNENLDEGAARQQITTQQARLAIAQSEIEQYEATLKEKEEDLATTQKLAATGADTRQNVWVKEKEKKVILATLKSARAQLSVGIGELNSLKTKAELSALNAENRFYRAPKAGTLVSLDAKVGAAISAFTVFGSLAPAENLILHGEVDELFANMVKLGQKVDVNFIGQANLVAKGQIIYLSPILENKSLFYEKSGETTDRRVRAFKVSLKGDPKLLINARVECKIKIQ